MALVAARLRPQVPRPAPPRVERRRAGSRLLLARVVVTLAGVGGFVGLLIAAVYAPSAQAGLRITAFVWFLAFGAVKVVLDLLASRASRRPAACVPIDLLGEHDGRMGGGRG